MAGLFRKYRVERNGEVISDQTMTFTLVPAHDDAAVEALAAYADFTNNLELSDAIYDRLDARDFSALPEEE